MIEYVDYLLDVLMFAELEQRVKVVDMLLKDGTIAALIVYLPGVMAVWFAPMLAAERGMTTGKAVFYSFFGCLRNIIPVIVLAASVALLFALVTVALVSIALMVSSQTLASVLAIPFVFLSATVMYASYWPMYRDLFEDLG